MTSVAFVVESTAFGGAEQYADQLLRFLPGPVTLVTTDAAPVRLVSSARAAGRLVTVPSHERGRAEPVALLDALHRLAPDVVHVNCVNAEHDRTALDVAALVAPAVATLHLPLPLHGVPDVPGLSATWRRLAACIVVSRSGRDLLVDGLGVAPDRVVQVRNGVELPPAPPPRPVRRPTLLSVARLDRQKGLDVLLDALALLPPAHRPASLTVLGEGAERPALEQRAEQLVSAGCESACPARCTTSGPRCGTPTRSACRRATRRCRSPCSRPSPRACRAS